MSRTRLRALRFTPDTAERHAIVGHQLGGLDTVLDVGGVEGQLAPFLRAYGSSARSGHRG